MKKFKYFIAALLMIVVMAMLHAPGVDAAIDAITKLKSQLATVFTDGGDGTYSLSASKVTTTSILDGTIGKADLATIVQPSHIVKYAGFASWSGITKSKKIAIVGALSTDTLIATPKTGVHDVNERLESAILKNNTAIFTLYTTASSASKTFGYAVHRATQ